MDEEFEEAAEKARKLRLKNFALAAVLVAFVVWSYFNSLRSVRAAADSLTGTDVAEIEGQLEEEEKEEERRSSDAKE